ncbi:hypothetical protein E2562_008071 [Oryza meyeriana var. granulata]|uniref:DUF1618 domain-containing protein n=1 Tax=Oryza meyeriana var. granulata TaxID=110450 RepID=A0A6G1DHZ0_9ORYZ|nr:hypothetical protein E2562_008071 [Oryza meyeriana var. granulata]KAF0911323.1 hypothetical protein E2562_008071 [Oryza meyeriana var. granulata]
MAEAECEVDWVMLDSDNPADSDDDDLILPLSSSCTTPAASDSDENDEEESDVDGEDLYGGDIEEESPRPPPPRPLSGIFYHTVSTDEPGYLAFDALRSAKQLIPDPRFSAFPEPVAVLASTRGLVCVRGETTGSYYVANPSTFRRVLLPRHARDHSAFGDPAVVVTFEEPDRHTAAVDGIEHYHVVVAFNLGGGVWAFESFSSRTWEWRVSSGISVVEQVVPASGVGAIGRAFWRTTIGYILYYDPEKDYSDAFPAPPEVATRPLWELGEMEGNLCVTCMDERVTEVAVLCLNMDHLLSGVSPWSWAGQFEGGMLRNREDAELLRSQGAAEVVMWDPTEERVVAMDLDGRTTRTIGPLTDGDYNASFIPFVASIADINSERLNAKCRAGAADSNTPNLGADANTLNLTAPAAKVH